MLATQHASHEPPTPANAPTHMGDSDKLTLPQDGKKRHQIAFDLEFPEQKEQQIEQCEAKV
jgi:hypothetical protein